MASKYPQQILAQFDSSNTRKNIQSPWFNECSSSLLCPLHFATTSHRLSALSRTRLPLRVTGAEKPQSQRGIIHQFEKWLILLIETPSIRLAIANGSGDGYQDTMSPIKHKPTRGCHGPDKLFPWQLHRCIAETDKCE